MMAVNNLRSSVTMTSIVHQRAVKTVKCLQKNIKEIPDKIIYSCYVFL